MTTGEIVQIVSIVILSGITGYYAFQTKRQADILSKQVNVANRQQKIELLNEIIQWAEDASRLGIEQGSQDMISHLDSDESLEFLSKQANKLETGFQPIRVRSVYIEKVAARIDASLGNSAINLREKLSQQIGFLYQCRNEVLAGEEQEDRSRVIDIHRVEDASIDASNNNSKLYEAAIHVIEETVRIKTSMAELPHGKEK